MGGRLSSFGRGVYDSKRREFLGRDGAGWAKLGIFYFFFYLGLAGFFCAMLAVFMAVTPKNRPRYYSEGSCMRTRSSPLSPGLGFRPQPNVERNLVVVNKDAKNFDNDPFVKNLNYYLQAHYPRDTDNRQDRFSVADPGDCTSQNQYGFSKGQPCVLVKMNKIVSFVPEPGYTEEDRDAYQTPPCPSNTTGVPVYCYGEYPADADNIGKITYKSEFGRSNQCGSLNDGRFPYSGKIDRQDVYQAPYVWVQFHNAKPNVLIHVICRIFATNVYFDRKTSRALTRFQIFIQDKPSQ